jgi:hypothetical protein
MGVFDFTFERSGFVPKEVPVHERNFFDPEYYKIMCKSKFALCPAGDASWSMRFYEALMCHSIPILFDHRTFRSQAESALGYRYYTRDDKFEFTDQWALENYDIFLEYHTLAK